MELLGADVLCLTGFRSNIKQICTPAAKAWLASQKISVVDSFFNDVVSKEDKTPHLVKGSECELRARVQTLLNERFCKCVVSKLFLSFKVFSYI